MANKETKKICKKHGLLKEEDIYFYKTKINNLYPRCKICMIENTKRMKEKGYFKEYSKSGKSKLSNKKYYEKVKSTQQFKEKRKKYYSKAREWYKENKNSIKFINNRRYRGIRDCKNLKNYYVKKLIYDTSNLDMYNIPDCLVQAKKYCLMLKRKIRDYNK